MSQSQTPALGVLAFLLTIDLAYAPAPLPVIRGWKAKYSSEGCKQQQANYTNISPWHTDNWQDEQDRRSIASVMSDSILLIVSFMDA